MGPIGAQEMIAIVLLALLLFGPKKLPELGRLLGKGLTEFRRAKNELTSTFESHMRELDREARLSEQADAAAQSKQPASSPAIQEYTSATYPYPYDEYGRESPVPSETVTAPAEPVASAPAPVADTVPRTKPSEEPIHAPAQENHPA